MLSQGDLTQAESIALAWSLAQPEHLARVDPQSRQRFQAAMLAISISRLFGIGLGDLALERFNGLTPDLQTAVLALDREEAWTAVFDGVLVQIRPYANSDRMHLNLAAASILAGREDQALAFAPPSSISAETRRAFACATDIGRSDRQRCSISYPPPSKFPLVLERLFGRSQTDPYLFAEALFSSDTGSDLSYGEVKVTCRLLAAEAFAELCRNKIAQSLGQTDPAQEHWQHRDKPGLAGIPTLAADPALREATARLAAQQRELVTRDASDLFANAGSRGTVLPAPAPFAELALAEAVHGEAPRPSEWPSDAGPLPRGFMPVRFERNGNVAVAVSISATLDPTGEISQGGYWVHRSSDGGRTWDAPHYTGLAQFFPYVVPDAARLPLIAGDGIDLEVEVREIDTASITYPPVGLRSRRIARDLYLHIPFAELERDSDDDGLNDLAARHLLLDPKGSDMPRASVVGGPSAPPCRTGSTESAALSHILTQLFGIEARAIVEPVDAPNDLAARLTAWRSSANSGRGPIFLQGDPAQFACLRADRMLIVYDAAAMRAMSQFSPDFRPIAIPSIVMNADKTRGFLVYSLGWRGGTLRLLRHGDTWQTETLEDWIT
jgi:hypothetical protein